ncbi:MAG TPA: hypothetical protein VH637_14735 [Streptosporangiaceae bacterium]
MIYFTVKATVLAAAEGHMGTSSSGERAALVRSLAIMSEYHWMFLRHLHAAVASRFGQPGLDVLARGLRRYGFYRGECIRDSPPVLAAGRDALALVRHWDGGELALAAAHGGVEVSVADGKVSVRLPAAPGADYFAGHGGTEALGLHWRQVLAGMAEGFDEQAGVTCDPAGATPWRMTWTHPAQAAGGDAGLDDVFAAPARYIEVSRRATGLIAALQMYPAMELADAFDASAEEAVREAAYAFGAERGAALRARHLAAGIPVDLQTMSQTLAERDPLGAIFSIRGPAYSSPGLSQFDCTYCPLADVWAQQGTEGLKLGYLFDMELHRGLVETYHPGAVVRWDALKTRGDAMCRFRFSIPGLVTPAEAHLLAPSRDRPRRAGPA